LGSLFYLFSLQDQPAMNDQCLKGPFSPKLKPKFWDIGPNSWDFICQV
jgi:hypothetical protein